MIERILGRFRYVKQLQLELRERKHNEELYQKLIASMTTHRDLLMGIIADQKSIIARLDRRDEDREKHARELIHGLLKNRLKGGA